MAFTKLHISLYFFALFSSTFAFIQWIEPRHPLKGDRPVPGSPWPMPKSWKHSNKLRTIDPNSFYILHSMKDCDIMVEAVKRYKNIILIDKNKMKMNSNLEPISGIHIQVTEDTSCGYPKLGDKEKYILTIESRGVSKIHAHSVWAVLRGLETFSQLVWQDERTNTYTINETKIEDEPRFSHRGILLDSARHFQPMSVIKKNLDAMSYNKFNVFHWHLVDDQSFPFESKVFPELTKKGAYTPRHVYTQDDVKEIINYARLRGIRVIPEFDNPGHTHGFGKAFPELLTPCYGEGPDKPFTPNFTEHSATEILNPTKEFTFNFMKKFFKEVRGVFKDDFIHLGMDEVYYGCWKSNPNIAKFMKEKGWGKDDYHKLEQYYIERTVKNVRDTGYKYITWQDPVDNGVTLAPDSIIQVWKDKSLDTKMGYWRDYIIPIANKGYKMIISACWYLNYISYGPDWKKFYQCDPHDFNATVEQKEQVIGGEACLWAEYVDGTNLLARLWPRASAVAERLWSPKSVNDVDSANFRLDQQRCRMLRRGIAAQPILNGYCGDYEWEMEETVNSAPVMGQNLWSIALFAYLFYKIFSMK